MAAESGGRIIAHNLRGIVVRKLTDQLSDIGIGPEDVTRVILSHGHFDHIGNARMFQHAAWYIQRREHEALFGADHQEYGYSPPLYESLKKANVQLMEGDHDLFGDGSLRVISTPGQTPGHCSLLVRLPKTGTVMLSADVAHYRYNLDNRIVPTINSSPEETRASMDRVVAVVRDERAQLWLDHDAPQNATIMHAPAFYD